MVDPSADGNGLSHGGTRYGAVPMRAFSLATAAPAGHGPFAVSIMPAGAGAAALRAVARQHASRAAGIVASEGAGRFLGEAFSYVRSVRGDGADWAVAGEDDVRRSLEAALRETDPFRAAVAFERGTPYLVGDVGLVRLMSGFLRDMESADRAGAEAAAAREMESEACERSDFARRVVAAWRAGSAPEGTRSSGRMG